MWALMASGEGTKSEAGAAFLPAFSAMATGLAGVAARTGCATMSRAALASATRRVNDISTETPGERTAPRPAKGRTMSGR